MTNMNKPTVTVVITCYNYVEYVGEAIQSVLSQTYDNIDLLVIDDGSTDDSLDIINKYQSHDRVRIISRANKGIVYTRNEALRQVKSDFICFLDADDYFDESYVSDMVAVAESTGADVTYPNWRIFGDDNYTMTFSEFDVQKLIRQEIHCTSESLMRRASLGGHIFQSEEVAEDWDFFLGLALDGRKFKLAKNCFINYRVRKGTRGAQRTYWEDMYYFCEILKKWNKRYPRQVNPFDLPIYAGRMRDEHIESQQSIIRHKDEKLEEYDYRLKQQTKDMQTLKDELRVLRGSLSYRLGRTFTGPFRALKHIFSTRK